MHSCWVEKGLQTKNNAFTALFFTRVRLGARLNICKLIFELVDDVGFGQTVKAEFASRELGQLLWLQRWNDEPIRNIDAELITT